MSIRHLDSFFDPRSVAVIGASDRPASVGHTVWHNLREGGFSGPRWAVNPRRVVLDGETAWGSVDELPDVPELAIVCTPPAAVPGVIAALARRGTRAAVVLTAGLDRTQRQAMLDAARPSLLRILGPNCLGLLAPHAGLNASFAHVGAQRGELAFISQSGALVTAMLDWARERGIGFSHFVSLGEHADVDFGDLLDWLASDARTRAILLYVESIDAARKFMSAARAAARNKPVLVVKSGRSPQGQAAAASHTGALAGADLVYDAAIRRAGMLRVDTLQDLFVAAEILSHGGARAAAPGTTVLSAAASASASASPPGATPDDVTTAGDDVAQSVTLVTNGGGAGVMAADAAASAGITLAPLPDAVRAALDVHLPPNWSRANPVDIIGDAPVERYVQTLQTLLAEPVCGTIVFMHAPTAIVPSADIARALLPLARQAGSRLLACWLGGPGVAEARRCFRDAGVAQMDTPEDAVKAFAMMATYRRNQQQLMQVPPASVVTSIDLACVRRIVDAVLQEGRHLLTEPEAKSLLAACGIGVVETLTVGPSATQAAYAAEQIGFPVALKILSPQITHKSDVGGVALDLEDAAAVRDSAAAMLRRVAQQVPDAHITGFTVQAMVRRPQALELIVGASVDPLFGPVILFGAGGTSVEVVADRAIALPPLNAPLAEALIARTRVSRLLAGWRDVPAADRAALVRALITVGQLLAEEPRIAELDINPLLADAKGVLALDARVRVDAAGPSGAAHFAIRPYPAALVEAIDWHGRRVTLRPIRPEDEAQHRTFLERLDPVDIRMRVFYSRRSIARSELARLMQIDYEREMAFVATARDDSGVEETLGVVRALCDPDNQDAEFGIVVRSDLKGGGLGERLMHKLIAYLQERGTQRLVGTVLAENVRMLQLARDLGFVIGPLNPDDGTHVIERMLTR